jgi:hypothetical protein
MHILGKHLSIDAAISPQKNRKLRFVYRELAVEEATFEI